MRALVTGGGGFLGRALVRRLVERGDSVRSLARGEYPALAALGVEVMRGDVTDAAAVARAASGVDVVFHVAAKAGVGGRFADYVHSNLRGTEVVVAACQQAGVPRLVYTSTPSVVFDPRGHEGADESTPRTTTKISAYAWTKARAEEHVLAAHGPALATCALRPHLIWGPEDTQLTARILARARAGRLRLVAGGRSRVDTIYIDNAVDAHLDAAEALARGTAGGKAYFLSNDDPRPIADIMGAMLAAGGLPKVTRSIPLGAAYAVGAVLELAFAVLRRQDEPLMTRFVALQLGTPHWFDISAAKRDLGFVPRVSIDEGMARLERWLAESARAGA